MTRNPGAGLPERLDLALQIAAGMHHAHTCAFTDEKGSPHRGLVHRDLKPENAIITKEHRVRIMDLGVARLAEESRDKSLAMFCTGGIRCEKATALMLFGGFLVSTAAA